MCCRILKNAESEEEIMMIKLGFIGLGQRGQVLLKNVLGNFPDAEVAALCDVYEDRIEICEKLLREKGRRPAAAYQNYTDLLCDENVNVVIISASWEAHIPMAIASMKSGKITGLEVGGAYSIQDCWDLVRTYQSTKTPFMFLENCCYGKKELLAANLANAGVLGEIVYCHGAYSHDLREEIAGGYINRHYRLRNYIGRNCDNYPTHELGPIAKMLKINRGNRMLSLVSVSSKARGMAVFVGKNDKYASLQGKTFRQGDVVETLITCADGALISLKLDTTLPHAYSRELTVSGTKGMYSEQGNIVLEEGTPFDHEKDMNEYYNTAAKYEEKYLPDIWKNITEKEIAAGHGGMDTLMLRDFFETAAEGREMPIDVYDAASWMAVSCLSEMSVQNNGRPVDIPDFTGGEWLLRK